MNKDVYLLSKILTDLLKKRLMNKTMNTCISYNGPQQSYLLRCYILVPTVKKIFQEYSIKMTNFELVIMLISILNWTIST